VKDICKMLKISRQAFYKERKSRQSKEFREEVIIQLVRNIRRKLPRAGGRKLYHMLKGDLDKISSQIGRDKFFSILAKNGMLVKPLKRYKNTTNSHHWFRIYSNLIKDLTVDGPNKVFVSDITYIRLRGNFCYLFLVTDLYSRKIVGYHLSMTLAAQGAIKAMKMALKGVRNSEELIHHSDRGIQYCCDEYVKLLKSNKIKISMGEAGNPYDNAVAERVNGILKNEFYLNATFIDFNAALKAVKDSINIYNYLRPHMSLDYKTPAEKYAA
jgi:transposase InsO family protein